MSMETRTGWAPEEMARRVALDIPDGACVNLGIGLPTLVSSYIPSDREVVFHSENGVLGMGPPPTPHDVDPDLTDAGKQPATVVPGAAFFHHADSFGMVRGGHIDICILGAFQVSTLGDLANWSTGDADAIPAVGGAMDLAVGAKHVFVMMTHLTKQGRSKIVDICTYPLTAARCVDRIFTDLAVLEVSPEGLIAQEIVDGLSHDDLVELSGVPLIRP
jgi:3-oxoadipate CoA-transferase, beta subunit